MVFSKSNHAVCEITRLRNPLTTLKSATSAIFAFSHSPISCAVASGLFLESFRKGNTTSVRFPSNSALVFCNCTIFSGTSCPYNALIASITEADNLFSMFISICAFEFGCEVTIIWSDYQIIQKKSLAWHLVRPNEKSIIILWNDDKLTKSLQRYGFSLKRPNKKERNFSDSNKIVQ